MHKPPRPPITHRSGNGFGHVGSTSYFGPGPPWARIGEECDASAIRAAIAEHAMFRTTFGEFQVMTFSIEEVGCGSSVIPTAAAMPNRQTEGDATICDI